MVGRLKRFLREWARVCDFMSWGYLRLDTYNYIVADQSEKIHTHIQPERDESSSRIEIMSV